MTDRLFVPLGDVVERHKQWALDDNPRVPLGFPDVFDDRTNGGAAPGQVVMFVACSGVGKTIVACNVIVHAVLSRVPTVFFSLEMDAGQITQRLTAIRYDYPTRDLELDLRGGNDTFMDEFVQHFERYVSVIDRPGLRMSEMSQALEEAADEWGYRPRLVIVDYLELMGGQAAMTMNEGIDKLSKNLKSWTRKEKIVTFCLHQLNLGGAKHETKGDKPVTKRDIRYGGDVAADFVLAGWRPGLNTEPNPTEFRIQLLKTRSSGGLETYGKEYYLNVDSLRLTKDKPRLRDVPQMAVEGLF